MSVSIPLRNRIRGFVGGVFRRPMLKDRDRFLHRASADCRGIQQQTLKRILQLNAESDYSKSLHLTGDLASGEFNSRLPISTYDTIRAEIERMKTGHHSALLGPTNRLLMYAITSGTTSAAKLIPVTSEFLKDYRRGWQRWGISVQANHAALQKLKMVQLVSDHDQFRTADGTPCGNISGLVTSMQKAIVRKLYVTPPQTAKIEDSVAKRYAVLRFALAEPWVGMFVTANPSTLLKLVEDLDDNLDRLLRDMHDGTLTVDGISDPVRSDLLKRIRPLPDRSRKLSRMLTGDDRLDLRQCWPQLACLGVWSGGSAKAFQPALRRRFGDLPVRDHGLHASEGRMTIPFRDDSASGVLDIESHYFEFIPESEIASTDPVTLEAHQLDVGTCYYILLTTVSGLYRYNIFDVVRCTGFHGTTPLLEFLHKGAHISSITGEKITESQVVDAVQRSGFANQLRRFLMTPQWGDPPGYRLFVDGDLSLAAQAKLAEEVESALCHGNCEYQEKRGSGRLSSLECEVLPATTWQHFQAQRLAKTGGSLEQYKPPCLVPDPKFEQTFQTMAGLT